VLLNNDVVVADGWLGQLIGLVNMKSGPAGEVAGVSRDASADGAGRLRSIGVRGPETRAQRCGRDPGGFVSAFAPRKHVLSQERKATLFLATTAESDRLVDAPEVLCRTVFAGRIACTSKSCRRSTGRRSMAGNSQAALRACAAGLELDARSTVRNRGRCCG
jgi:hypothetical protein